MRTIKCPCGNIVEIIYKTQENRKKYCSKECFYKYRKIKIWNKGLKGIHLSPKSEFKKGMTPWNVGVKRTLEEVEKMRIFFKGKRFSKKTEFKKGQNPWNKGKEFLELRGDKHPNWRGEQTSYSNKHSWLKRRLGKANKCQNLDCVYPRTNSNGTILTKPKRFDWANISQEYKRDLDDWAQLCGSCHKRYDMGLINLRI